MQGRAGTQLRDVPYRVPCPADASDGHAELHSDPPQHPPVGWRELPLCDLLGFLFRQIRDPQDTPEFDFERLSRHKVADRHFPGGPDILEADRRAIADGQAKGFLEELNQSYR